MAALETEVDAFRHEDECPCHQAFPVGEWAVGILWQDEDDLVGVNYGVLDQEVVIRSQPPWQLLSSDLECVVEGVVPQEILEGAVMENQSWEEEEELGAVQGGAYEAVELKLARKNKQAKHTTICSL